MTALVTYRMLAAGISPGGFSATSEQPRGGDTVGMPAWCGGNQPPRRRIFVADQPDVSFLVVMTTADATRSGRMALWDWVRCPTRSLGLLDSRGTSALNHYIELDTDALMRRTASRPLPSGQLQPREAPLSGASLLVPEALSRPWATNALATLLGS